MAEHPSVIGRYEVVSRLGQGGMGSLYLAKDPKIGRLVAIKVVRQDFDSPEARQRFAREAQSAGTLRHPNIVTIFDVDEFSGLPFIAMEYVDGETLSEIVRRKAPFPITKRLEWIEELCAGLAYAHRQGVVHRDIKPANLMIDAEGSLKILDFGLARREASKFTQSQTVIGTPNYMSPEQIRAEDVGPRSDIFAVGCVLYEVLTCSEAFPGTIHQAMHRILYEDPKPLDQALPHVDNGLVTILAHALAKDPQKRYADLTIMRKELAVVRQRIERFVDNAATVAMPSPSPAELRGLAYGVDGGAPTIAPGPRGSVPGSAPQPPPSKPGSSGVGPGGSQRVSHGGAQRQTLEKKRAAQIEQQLNEARKQFDNGVFDKAREAIEHVLMIDPDHHVAQQLLDEIGAEEERQHIAKLVAEVRTELQEGRLDSAERLLAQAIEAAPDSQDILELREAVETTRREIDRARQATDMLRRAKQRFSEGSFEGAVRAVAELLAIDPNNAAARDLQARAHEAIEAKAKKAERDAAAQKAVTEARALFERGDEAAAIAMLETFTPPHVLVTSFLGSLRGEQMVAPPPDPAPAPVSGVSAPISGVSAPVSGVSAPMSGVSPQASDASPVASAFSRKIEDAPSSGVSAPISGVSAPASSTSSVASGLSRKIVDGPSSGVSGPMSGVSTPLADVASSSNPVASGFPALSERERVEGSRKAQASRTPLYAGLAVAAVAVVGIGLYMSSGDSTRAPETPAPATAAAPAPAPVIPPPAVVTAPASLESEPKTQNNRDAMEAYKLLAAGKHADASKIVARIAKRDPKNENLADLRTQIQKVADTEKQRTAAMAAAAAKAPANTPASAPMNTPASTPATTAATTPTNTPPVVPANANTSAGAGATSPAANRPVAPPVANNPVSPAPPSAAPATSAPATSAPATAAPKPDVAPPPAAAPSPPPPSPAEVERPAIEASIREYSQAMSSMNLQAVGQVRRFTPAQVKNWDNLFKSLSTYRLHVKVLGAPTVNGDRATIPVEEQVATAGKKDKIQMFQTPRTLDYKLEKIGGKWMILPPG